MSLPVTIALALAFVLANFAVKLGLWVALSSLPETSFLRALVSGVIPLLLVCILTRWLVRKNRPNTEPSLDLVFQSSRRPARYLLLGSAVGALMLLCAFAALVLGKWLRVAPRSLEFVVVAALLGEMLVTTTINAVWEEYVFRGWAFSILCRKLGLHAVALFLGVAFGLVHMVNPHWSALSIASVAIAGWMLSYAMLYARTIALPIGIHVGWNLMQGFCMSSRLWIIERDADPVKSGGVAGIEGSAASVVVTAMATLVLFLLVLRRGSREQA